MFIFFRIIIFVLVSAFLIMPAPQSYGWGKKEEKAEARQKVEYQFYPIKSKNKKMPINQEQNWQLCYELLSRGQFAKKRIWLDVLLGEKQELDPFIDTPIDITVIEGKAFILDQGRKSVWIYSFGEKQELSEITEFEGDNFADAYGMDTDGEFIFMTFPARYEIIVFDMKFNVAGKINCVFIPMRIKVSGDKLYVVDTGLQRNLNEPSPESVFVLDKESGEVLSVIGMPENIWKKFMETGDEAVLDEKEVQQPVAFSREAIERDHQKKRNGETLFCQPSDVDVDDNGNIYVSEERGGRVLKFDANGMFLDQFGIRGADFICFEEVVDVAVAPNGDIYAIDAGITMKGMAKGAVDIKSRPYIKFFSKEQWEKDGEKGNLVCLPHAVWGGESVRNELVGDKVPNMIRPGKIIIDNRGENIKYFNQFVSPEFKAEYLIWIVCQGGGMEKAAGKIFNHGKVMIFACGSKRQ